MHTCIIIGSSIKKVFAESNDFANTFGIVCFQQQHLKQVLIKLYFHSECYIWASIRKVFSESLDSANTFLIVAPLKVHIRITLLEKHGVKLSLLLLLLFFFAVCNRLYYFKALKIALFWSHLIDLWGSSRLRPSDCNWDQEALMWSWLVL